MHRKDIGYGQVRSDVGHKVISSPDNPVFKLANSLNHRKGREKTGLFLVEGFKLVEEALISPGLVDTLFLSDKAEELLPAESEGIPVIIISSRLARILAQTENSQGIWAICKQAAKGEFAASNFSGLLLILAEIQDPGNLGTMLRTAWAVGVDAVLLSSGSVDPYNSKVIRSAMGASLKLPIYTGILPEDIASLQKAGFQVLACDAAGEISLFQKDLKGKVAIIMGNEGHGLADHWQSIADSSLRIPLHEGVDSLNVAVACGIILYEAYRQRSIV